MKKFLFYRYTETSNGEYILLGRFHVSEKRRAHHLVMRVKKNGSPVWVKRIHTDKTRNNVGIIRRADDYYITCWYNTGGSSDKIEVLRIDTNGDLLQSALFSIGTDDQVSSIVRAGAYLTLVGGTNAGAPWDAFISFFHPNLTVDDTKTFLLNHPSKNSVEDILGLAYFDPGPVGMTKFYLVGRTRTGNVTTSILIEAHYSGIDLALKHAFTFNVTGGNDHSRKIMLHGGFIFILGQRAGTPYSYVVKLDMKYNLIWAKKFDIEEQHALHDMKGKHDAELWFSGFIRKGNSYESLIIKTDLDLNSCKTKDIPNVVLEDFSIKVSKRNTSLQEVQTEHAGYDIAVIDTPLEQVSLCPEPVIDITDDNWVQSPYLYLQNAGSLGQDAAQGILLRWFLLKNLGETHLPKGDQATTTNGFNKADDYVKIYRAKYDIKKQRTLHFKDHAPKHIINAERKWVYQVEEQVYYLFFKEEQKYDTLLNTYNPVQEWFQFITAYADGLYELEIRDRLAFAVEFNVLSTNMPPIYNLQTETFSVQGNLPLEEQSISSRKSFDQNNSIPRLVEENIRKLKFRSTNAIPISMHFEMYIDFLKEKVDTFGWDALGPFALSKEVNEVSKRLEDTSKVNVNGHWQKYNEDAFVKTQNYKDRWGTPPYGLDSLGHGVSKYIELSDTDPSATVTKPEEVDGGTNMDVSYFDLINMVSLDYHIARMLGLGHIDTPGGLETDQYIYLAEYITHGQLDYSPKSITKQHLYLTIPTSLQEERLPETIKTLPVEYGLNIYDGANQGIQLTDSNGYVPYAPIRYIDVKTDLLQDNTVYHGFFNPSTPFSLSAHSTPVFAGVEYKKQGEANWRKPEISHDANFTDASAQQKKETIPLPYQDDPTKSLLIHKETEEGIHGYAAYSVNIFSRASQIHNTVFTDYTQFVKPNTLLPPHNLNVQLIQKESPLMLTSNNEQSMLQALAGQPDKTLVRLTFLYTHLHDINYDFGNQIEVFFREELPRNVVGGIGSIQDDTNDKFSIITTQDYTYNSNGQTNIPNIPSTLVDNFKGGVLVLNEKRYYIEDVIPTNANGNYPKLKVQKEEDRNTIDLGGGHLVSTQSFLTPDASNGDLFMIIENMSIAQSWGAPNPLSFKINIDNSDWTTKSDSYIDDNGTTVTKDIRGIWDTATITRRISGPEGVYDVKLDNDRLSHHNQSSATTGVNSVNWYKGIIRVRIIDDTSGTQERKVLDVVQIVNQGSGQNLELIIHDEAYDTIATRGNIQEGSNIEINFYPGYRVYLHQDSPSGFNAASIMPTFGEGSKKTLMGLRTLDTNTQDSGGNDYHSKISIPKILFAQEIITPAIPKLPTGPAYATPPDFYGRSTFTFTTEFRAETYAAIFYRTDVNALLKALYKQETIDLIKNALPSPDEDEFYSDRLKDIIGFNYTEGTFTEFPLGSGNYNYPNPDNEENDFDGTAEPVDIINKIKTAIWQIFLPLTEQPLIYSFIKGGDYIPIPKKQTIRDKYGKLLNPTDPEYDLTPMAKALARHKVLFTDFTIDGEMSKETAYFYCVREMGNRMSLSEPSPILGPIQLINTNAPEAPIVRKVTTQLADSVSNANTAVKFEINEYPASQNIKKVQIYRTIEAVNAMTPRTMDLVKEFDMTSVTINNGIITVYDNFQFNNFLPFGEPLFYKIIACREIKYVDVSGNYITDYVPSKPTKTLLSNIVDNVNPDPPHINETIGSTANDELNGLVLNWNKTAHNAKYYLFKMNSVGNWNKLFEVQSNDETDLAFPFSDPVPKVDEDGNTIYHRFKVTVENSSGLLNLNEDVLTI